jgi:hypothetical protein
VPMNLNHYRITVDGGETNINGFNPALFLNVSNSRRLKFGPSNRNIRK